MLAFAEREFQLSAVEQGSTIREHLMAHWRQTKVEPELLATAPKLPNGAAHVWTWFRNMRADAGRNGRVTAAIIRDTEWLLGVKIELWERRAIRALDTLYLRGLSTQ